MRNKSVREQTILKYIDFLNSVKDNSLPYECQVSLETIVTSYAINKSVVKPLQKLNIIDRKGKTAWEWTANKEPDKAMVLELLDYVLHSNKTQIPALLPDQITQITDLLKEISTKLDTQPIDIDKEFELVSSIAGGVYKSWDDLNNYSAINVRILSAAKDMLNKYNEQ